MDKKRRILLLIPSMIGVGGTERMVDGLSKLLVGNYEVIQGSFDPPASKRHFSSDTPFFPLGPLPRLPLPLRPLAYTLAAIRLRYLKKQQNIDVTISNLWGADLISLISGGADKKVCLVHINVIGNPTNSLLIRFKPLVSWLYRRADKVIGVSEALAQEFLLLYGLQAAKVSFIRNFVFAKPVSTLQSPPVQLAWCGRFVIEKDPQSAIRLWSAARAQTPEPAKLVMMGDGPLLEACKRLASELGMRIATNIDAVDVDIVFPGFTTDTLSIIGKSRGLMLTSRHEGIPLVMLEAMALGIPVLAADCPAGGVCEALSSDEEHDPRRQGICRVKGGWLLPMTSRPDHQSAWVEALQECLSDSPRHQTLRDDALKRAAEFGPEKARNAWVALIDQMIDAR